MSEADVDALEQSFSIIAEAARGFKDPWHIIGSAAAHVAGAEVGKINDIDLLLSIRDIEMLREKWPEIPAGPPVASDQFRSEIFYRFETPMPVAAMAAFELRARDGDWVAIAPKTRIRHGDLYAPDIAEQIAILRLMGRAKDAPRIAALQRLL